MSTCSPVPYTDACGHTCKTEFSCSYGILEFVKHIIKKISELAKAKVGAAIIICCRPMLANGAAIAAPAV